MLLAAEISSSMTRAEPDASPAADPMRALIDELYRSDADATWGSTFRLRDRVKLGISEGAIGEGMTKLDWGVWWALLEELDRAQSAEGAIW